MAGWFDTSRTDTPVETNPASESEVEQSAHGDIASVSDELTDALQAATYYMAAVRMFAADKPAVVDQRDRDVLALATSQITRANRAVRHLHEALTTKSQD